MASVGYRRALGAALTRATAGNHPTQAHGKRVLLLGNSSSFFQSKEQSSQGGGWRGV